MCGLLPPAQTQERNADVCKSHAAKDRGTFHIESKGQKDEVERMEGDDNVVKGETLNGSQDVVVCW